MSNQFNFGLPTQWKTFNRRQERDIELFAYLLYFSTNSHSHSLGGCTYSLSSLLLCSLCSELQKVGLLGIATLWIVVLHLDLLYTSRIASSSFNPIHKVALSIHAACGLQDSTCTLLSLGHMLSLHVLTFWALVWNLCGQKICRKPQ